MINILSFCGKKVYVSCVSIIHYSQRKSRCLESIFILFTNRVLTWSNKFETHVDVRYKLNSYQLDQPRWLLIYCSYNLVFYIRIFYFKFYKHIFLFSKLFNTQASQNITFLSFPWFLFKILNQEKLYKTIGHFSSISLQLKTKKGLFV